MRKIIILLLGFIILLGGCDTQTDEEILANQSQFNVTFNEINHETNTATFTVSGLPNDEEFAQIQNIVIASMDANKPEKDTKYVVSVYSDLQSMEDAPLYGTVTYQNQAIVDGELTPITQEQYISLSETTN